MKADLKKQYQGDQPKHGFIGVSAQTPQPMRSDYMHFGGI